MKLTASFLKWILALIIIVTTAGCSDDDKNDLREGYGFVQLRLLKSGSYTSRAGEGRLDFLYEAKKIKLTLLSSDNYTISQTLSVDAPNSELGEYGMLSDKLQLLEGDYTIVGYELFNTTDESIYSGSPENATVISVPYGGLVIQDIVVNVVNRGHIKFELVKDDSKIATKAAGLTQYPFRSIMYADVTIQNKLTLAKTEFKGMKMTHEVFRPEDRPDYYSSRCITDTIVTVLAGTYQVTGFVTYFDQNKQIKELSDDLINNEFTVKDNEVTLAEVPITLEESAGDVKDGLILKKIWEALDGPNWRVKWDFNRDIDLWTAQPGVEVLSNGRIASLNFTEVGAKGDMPAFIGELEELRQLYLGSHNFNTGSSNANSSEYLRKLGATDPETFRRHFNETITPHEPLYQFGPEFVEEFKTRGVPLKEKKAESASFAVTGNIPFNYSNQIYSLPDEINNLKKLSQLYIAYSPIKTLPSDLSGMESLSDLEVFCCPDMTEFPEGIATLPRLLILIFSGNENIPPEKMKDGLIEMTKGPSKDYLQGFLMPNQPLRSVPDLRELKLLNELNLQNCGVEKFEEAFGKDFFISYLNCTWNELEDLPRDADGYFMAVQDQESVLFAHNKFKKLPDIFNAKSKYVMKMVDFSFNKITDIENGENESKTYKGINVEQFFLYNNQLKRFPKEILKSNSIIHYLQLAGNGIEDIDDDAFEGDNVFEIVSLDLSYNKLKKLPKTFHSATFPYLYGVNLSNNRFDHFPMGVADLRSLSIFMFRAQRDANGNRIMREWPTGIYNRSTLRSLYLGSNDLRKITDYISPLISIFEIADNPNIAIDVSSVCAYISAGSYLLIYDPWQDIRGCDSLNLDH